MVLNPRAQFTLAQRFHNGGAPLGEVFSFISGLYFRGKMAYAERFANPPSQVGGALVITASRGLLPPETQITPEDLRQIANVPIDAGDARYRGPLERDARRLSEAAGPGCPVVLLGSVASTKYIDPLLSVFGDCLQFPREFVGRGDMSRGGLLLRHVKAGVELDYIPVRGAVLHGQRPPKLPRQY